MLYIFLLFFLLLLVFHGKAGSKALLPPPIHDAIKQGFEEKREREKGEEKEGLFYISLEIHSFILLCQHLVSYS